jgi:hypothetical protein
MLSKVILLFHPMMPFRQNLRRVDNLSKDVGDTVPFRLQRYKDNIKRSVQRRNIQIESGYLGCVMTFDTELCRSLKLEFPAA